MGPARARNYVAISPYSPVMAPDGGDGASPAIGDGSCSGEVRPAVGYSPSASDDAIDLGEVDGMLTACSDVSPVSRACGCA